MEPAPGFTGVWQGRFCLVQAVLQRTAVVYEPPAGERQLANKRDLLVDPADVRWQQPALAPRGQFTHRVPEPAAAVADELEAPAVDEPAAQTPPPLEQAPPPRPSRHALEVAAMLDQLPPELLALVTQATHALLRGRRLEEELEQHLTVERRILRGIRRLGLSDPVGERGTG
jgi:hypothetical protein